MICDMQFQTEELEYMIQAYIWGDRNRTEAQTRGQGSGMKINYGELDKNKNEQIVRVARVLARGWML